MNPSSVDGATAGLPAERLKFFTDAVVAIAMTLLILPLVDSVTQIAGEGHGVADYLALEGDQLFSFALSFVLIATFWASHQRLYAGIERATPPLFWLTVAWMFTIVWLPVPTAMLGAMPEDSAQKVLYIGSLLTSSLVLLIVRAYVLRHPALHTIPREQLVSGLVADIILIGLLGLALVVAVAVPQIGYFALFLLPLRWPIQVVVVRGSRGLRPRGEG